MTSDSECDQDSRVTSRVHGGRYTYSDTEVKARVECLDVVCEQRFKDIEQSSATSATASS